MNKKQEKLVDGLLTRQMQLQNEMPAEAVGISRGPLEMYRSMALAAIPKIFDSNNCYAMNLVSFQGMENPASIVKYVKFYYKQDGITTNIEDFDECKDKEVCLKHEEHAVAAVARLMPFAYTIPEYASYSEDQIVQNMVTKYVNVINDEVIKNIKNNVGTHLSTSWKEEDSFWLSLSRLSNVIHRKTLLGGANWVIV